MDMSARDRKAMDSLDAYARDIEHCTPLSREDETALARRARAGDELARQDLVRANLRFVVSVARRYLGHGLSLGELVSEGNMGLLEAAARFDQRRGCKFITYAVWWIRQAICKALDQVGKEVWPRANRINDLRILRREERRLAQDRGFDPTADDLAAGLGWTRKRVEKALATSGSDVRLDEPLHAGEGEEDALLDKLPDPAVDLQEALVRDELAETLRTALADLDDREQRVLVNHFGLNGEHDMNMEQVGRMMGISRERVRQLRNQALKKMHDRYGDILVSFSQN